MAHQITITVSDEVYEGLRTVAGGRTIEEFLEELARPILSTRGLESAYQAMSLDAEREREAGEWIEAVVTDSATGGRDAAR